MIALSGVTKSYAEDINLVHVLDRVDLQVEKGAFVYLLGGSGAGKTSLLRLLATEEGPTSGTISLFGYPLHKTNHSTLQHIRRSIGYIPQRMRLLGELTVFEHLELASKIAHSKSSRDRLMEILQSVDLKSKAKHRATELSGGEAQRLAIAMALSKEPELILADEPTGAQDRDHTWGLMELFVRTQLMRQATVVIATHDRDIVRRVRKKCLVLQNGQLTVNEGACIF